MRTRPATADSFSGNNYLNVWDASIATATATPTGWVVELIIVVLENRAREASFATATG